MNKKYLIIFLILIVVVVFLPIEFTHWESSKGKILPHKSWFVIKGTDGRLITSVMDYSTGTSSEYSVVQFERGDAVNFKLTNNIIVKGTINKGDTLGRVISSEIEKDLQKLKGELETARAALSIRESGEKESVIKAEQNRLKFAKKELDKQTKVFERTKELFKRNLIAKEDYEADEARFELAKININIVEEKLRSLKSGAKLEELNFARAQINSLESRINVLQKRYEKNIIVSPIDGVIEKTFSSDTLLIINDISKAVIISPFYINNLDSIKINNRVIVSSTYLESSLYGKVINIDHNIRTVNNKQVVLVTTLVERINDFKNGLIVDCKINCGKITVLEYLNNFLKHI